jgi:prolyl-tRNA synthetase
VKDRHDRDFCIGPTHEEVITDLVRRDVRSYRELPLNLYQIQTKFRDEVRPRFGLMRGREFIMKDGYSFHTDYDDCRREYEHMRATYGRIFRRCGLAFRAVEADTGAIGGTMSHEFQVLASSGEDLIISCAACDYAANVEMAEARDGTPSRFPSASLTEVATPGMRTIEEVSGFLKMPAERFIKTLVFIVDDTPVAALVGGDDQISETKLKRALKADVVRLAEEAEVEKATGAPQGFAGPVKLAIPVIADVRLGRLHRYGDRREQEGRALDRRRPAARLPRRAFRRPAHGARRRRLRALRRRQARRASRDRSRAGVLPRQEVQREAESDVPRYRGCGSGLRDGHVRHRRDAHDGGGDRAESRRPRHHLADVDCTVRSARHPGEVRRRADEESRGGIYEALWASGVETLIDDRDERAGVKFNDADLIGIPWRITVGPRGLKAGTVELKARRGGDAREIAIDRAASEVADLIRVERA